MNKNPLVSITTSTYNAQEWVVELLESLINQDYPAKDIEIIIVDDGSQDRTVEIVQGYQKKHLNIKLLTQKNQGTAAANTRGLASAKGDYVLKISHDTFADPSWVSAVVAEFEKNPKVGIVQGMIMAKGLLSDFGDSIVHCTILTTRGRSFPTVAVAYRALALEKAGKYYLEELSRYGDDSELAFRILENGYTDVWLDKPTAYHAVVKSSFWKELKAVLGCYRFSLLYKLHPKMRYFLHFGFLWGSKWRYLEVLFLPLTLLVFILAVLTMKKRIIFGILYDLLLTATFIYGSFKYRSLIL